MASTFIQNISLDAENNAEYIEGIEHVGAYFVIIRCKNDKGTHSIFHIAASKLGQSRVKRTVSVAGESGEELTILWPADSQPILRFESNSFIPKKAQSYNLKII